MGCLDMSHGPLQRGRNRNPSAARSGWPLRQAVVFQDNALQQQVWQLGTVVARFTTYFTQSAKI
eukprot:7315738-Pyramimonas_sp.AAC.1